MAQVIVMITLLVRIDHPALLLYGSCAVKASLRQGDCNLSSRDLDGFEHSGDCQQAKVAVTKVPTGDSRSSKLGKTAVMALQASMSLLGMDTLKEGAEVAVPALL